MWSPTFGILTVWPLKWRINHSGEFYFQLCPIIFSDLWYDREEILLSHCIHSTKSAAAMGDLNSGKSVPSVGTASDKFGENDISVYLLPYFNASDEWLVARPGRGLCMHQDASCPYENANSTLYPAGKVAFFSLPEAFYDAKICKKCSRRSSRSPTPSHSSPLAPSAFATCLFVQSKKSLNYAILVYLKTVSSICIITE